MDNPKQHVTDTGIPIRYMDDDILVTDSISQLPIYQGAYIPPAEMMLICHSGRLRLDVNGQAQEVTRGDLLLCNSLHTITRIDPSPDFTCSIYCVTTSKAQSLLHVNERVMHDLIYLNRNPVVHLNEREHEQMHNYYLLTKVKLQAPGTKYFRQSLDGVLQGALYDLLTILDRNKQETQGDDGPNVLAKGSTQSNTVNRFLVLLSEDDCQHRTVDYFAGRLCISSKYLCALCKQQTGKAPSVWIRERLVEKIRYYLTSTSLSAKEIAAALDMPSSSFFGKFTKKYLGMTPMEYRDKMK